MDMVETANKIAADKLSKDLWEENRKLRRELSDVCDKLADVYLRIYLNGADIEIERGRKVIYHGNDGGGNTARLPAGEIPESAGSNTRRA